MQQQTNGEMCVPVINELILENTHIKIWTLRIQISEKPEVCRKGVHLWFEPHQQVRGYFVGLEPPVPGADRCWVQVLYACCTCWASLVLKASRSNSTAAEGSTNLRAEPTMRANRQRSSCMKAMFLLSCQQKLTVKLHHFYSNIKKIV